MSFETIAKFGGTSVAQPELVRAHVQYDDPEVVVVSAPGVDNRWGFSTKVTDLLLATVRGRDSRQEILRRYQVLAREMGLADTYVPNIDSDLYEWRSCAWPVEALGERWSASLYAAYLDREFVDATELIRFDRRGCLDINQSTDLIRERLEPSGRYVVPGFYGANELGQCQVLGRGGSDVTPAVIALALGTSECHIWSDVDGFMSDDPATTPEAELLGRLSYGRVLALAEQGCQLLHADVCRLLGNSATTTVLRNTFGPAGNRGTVVRREWANELELSAVS